MLSIDFLLQVQWKQPPILTLSVTDTVIDLLKPKHVCNRPLDAIPLLMILFIVHSLSFCEWKVVWVWMDVFWFSDKETVSSSQKSNAEWKDAISTFPVY